MTITKTRRQTKLSLQANFSWLFIGNLIYSICQWGMLVAIARFGSPEMVGQFALGLAITAPVMMFASLRMGLIQATDAKGEYLFADYLGLRLITTILAMLVILLVSFFSDNSLYTKFIIISIGLSKAIESISDIYYGLAQANERMDRIAISMIIRGSFSLLALAVVLYLTNSLIWGIFSFSFVWLFVLLFYDMRTYKLLSQPLGVMKERKLQRNFNIWNFINNRRLWQLFLLGLPLGFVLLMDSLLVNIPRYFIHTYHGEYLLGIFAALTSFDRVGALLVRALGPSASTKLSIYFAANKVKAFITLLLNITFMGVLMGVGLITVAQLFGNEILRLFFGAEYTQGKAFVMLMAATSLAFLSDFLLYGLTVARRLKIQFIIYLIVGVVLTVLCATYIPAKGLIGAGEAFIYTRLFEFIMITLVTVQFLLFFQKTVMKKSEEG